MVCPERGVFIGSMGRPTKMAVCATLAVAAFAILMAPGAIKAEVAIPKVLFMRVTAYSSSPDETDSTPFITASGMHVRDGIVATNLLPLGTQIEIPSLFGKKVFTVEDRMSPRIKNTIDIWMRTKAAALRFGANETNILILPSPA